MITLAKEKLNLPRIRNKIVKGKVVGWKINQIYSNSQGEIYVVENIADKIEIYIKINTHNLDWGLTLIKKILTFFFFRI